MGQLLGMSNIFSPEGTVILIIVIILVVVRVYFMLGRSNGRRAKCPKCGNVFDSARGPTLVHAGPYRSLKCPVCGKSSMMRVGTKDPITWPKEEDGKDGKDEQVKEDDLDRRLQESKFER